MACERIAVRARLVGEGGSTYACSSRTPGGVAGAAGAVANTPLVLRVRRGEAIFGAVANSGCPAATLTLRLRFGDASPGGPWNPSGFGTAAGVVGASMQSVLSMHAATGGGVKNKGGCSDFPAGVPCMVSKLLLNFPLRLFGLSKVATVRPCFRPLVLGLVSMVAPSLSEQYGVLWLEEHGISASEDMADPMSVLSSSSWRADPCKSCRFRKNPNLTSALCATIGPEFEETVAIFRHTGMLGLVLSIINEEASDPYEKV